MLLMIQQHWDVCQQWSQCVCKSKQTLSNWRSHIHYLFIETHILSNLIKNQFDVATYLLSIYVGSKLSFLIFFDKKISLYKNNTYSGEDVDFRMDLIPDCSLDMETIEGWSFEIAFCVLSEKDLKNFKFIVKSIKN